MDNRSRRRLLAPILAAAFALPAPGQQTEPEKLIDAGHWKKARAIVETRFGQNPNDALENFLLSQIRNAFGDYTSPPALAEKAVSLDGHVAKYHRQLAEVIGIEAQHAGPIKLVFLAHQFRSEIDSAIELDPHDVQAQRDLLEYYLVAPGIAGGDVQRAATTAEHIRGIDAAEGFLAKARIALFRKQPTEAESFLRQAVASRPDSYRAHLELARFYLAPEHTNLSMAESVAKELLKLDSGRVDPYAILARVFAERSDWNALDETFSEAARQNPDDLAPYYRAAEALLADSHDAARAERYLRIYLEHEPEGNEPSVAEARRKLTAALEAQKRRSGVLAASN